MLGSLLKVAKAIASRLSASTGAKKTTTRKPTLTVQPNYNQYSGRLGVGSSSTLVRTSSGGNYNPQQTAPSRNVQTTAPATGLQRGSYGYNPQYTAPVRSQVYNRPAPPKPLPPPPPPKKDRKYTLQVFDNNTNKFKTIHKVQNLTDKEWKRAQAVIKRKQQIYKDFEAKRKNYKNEFEYQADIARDMMVGAERAQKQIEIEYNRYNGLISSLNQQLNDFSKKSQLTEQEYNEALNIEKQIDAYITEFEAYQESAEIQFTAYNEVAQAELDKKNIFPDTRNQLEKVRDATVKPIWDYSLGEKGVIDPKRIVNTALNVINPDRTIHTHDGDKLEREGNNNRSLRDAWNLSQGQRYWAHTDLEGMPDLEKNTIRLVDFFAENALDPSYYIGVGEIKAGAKVVLGAQRLKKASDAVKGFKGALGATKGGQVVKWLNAPAKTRVGKLGDKLKDQKGQRYDLAKQKATAFGIGSRKAWDEAVAKVRTDIRKISPDINIDLIAKLPDVDEKIVQYAQRLRLSKQTWVKKPNGDWVKTGWGTAFPDMTDKEMQQFLRGFSKGDKQLADDIARNMDMLADFTFSADSRNAALRHRKNYIPFDDGSANFRKAKSIDTNTIDGFKKSIQSPQQLQQSLVNRYFKSSFGETARFAKVTKEASSEEVAAFAGQTRAWKKYQKRAKDIDGQVVQISEQIAKTQKQLKTAKNVSKANPMNLWRKSVLAWRPAWYVNNEIYNQLAGLTAGGAGFLKYQKGWKEYLKSLGKSGDDLVSAIGDEIGGGALAKVANSQEARARVALYRFFTEKGLDHEQAVAGVNRWLFDYTVTNLDKPFRAVMPFWMWQKNLSKRILTLPVESPRAAKAWRTVYQGAYETPLNQLPDETIEGVDPNTGESFSYNPREAHKGKIYNPFNGKWYNTPFNPFTPKGATNIDKNPVLVAFDELATNRDRWGNKLNNQKWWESFAKAFPQFTLGKQWYETYVSKPQNTDRWLAQGSALPKSAQGYDKNARNYKESLDPSVGLMDNFKAFLGIPKGKAFDAEDFKRKKAYIDFNQQFWKTDWDQYDYLEKRKKQEELARKFGFDLQKDIYDDFWSKYDTEFTSEIKALKKDAAAVNKEFWESYHKIPKGNAGKVSDRKIFINEKRVEWEQTKHFEKNPYYNTIKAWMIDKKRPDAQTAVDELTFWREYFSTDNSNTRQTMFKNAPKMKDYPVGAVRSLNAIIEQARLLGQAKYRASSKGQFWKKFFDIKDVRKRTEFYAENWKPEFGGKGLENPQETLFWLEYFSANPDERKAMLRANPEYRKFEYKPLTAEQWDEIRNKKRNSLYEAIEGNQKLAKQKDVWETKIEQTIRGKRAKQNKVIWKGR